MKLADGKVTLHAGDCLDVLAALDENSIDAVVTDPPYELGFMGKSWDASGIAFRPETWALVWRILKPGGHLVAFGAPKNYHRLACAIEDAGFEIRDSLMWVTGVGFPKSHNIGCSCDGGAIPCIHEEAEQTPECDLRSMRNADVSQAKSFDEEHQEVLLNGLPEQSLSSPQGDNELQADVWRKQSRMEGRRDISTPPWELRSSEIRQMPQGLPSDGEGGWICDGASLVDGNADRPSIDADGMRSSHGSQSAEQRTEQSGVVAGQSEPQINGTRKVCGKCGKLLEYKGFGTALKPAYEPIVLARKPLSEKTVAANVLRWGTGAINIDGCRVGTGEARKTQTGGMGRKANPVYGAFVQSETESIETTQGRWPANLIHDGSEEVLELFPKNAGANGGKGKFKQHTWLNEEIEQDIDRDKGSAARFFYSAKASKADRAGSKHPTVKPVSLMQWLVRMVTPPGGTVLDPFAGSGTTGLAAVLEGFEVQLIEREPEYQADIQRRFND